MNRAVSQGVGMRRIAWKEFRQLLPIALAFGVTAFVISVLISQTNSTRAGEPFHAFLGSLWLSLFGVLCGSILFAAEKEHQTFAGLSFLPITWDRVLLGKLLGAAGFLLIVPALVLSTNGLRYLGVPVLESTWPMAVTMLSGTLLYFAIGVLYSIVCQRVLVAAVLAIATGSTIDGYLLWLNAGSGADFMSLEPYTRLVGWRFLLAFACLLIAIPLSRRWWLGVNTESRRQRESASSRTRLAKKTTKPGVWRRPILHMLWQSVHQNIVPLLLVSGVVIVPCTLVAIASSRLDPQNLPLIDGIGVAAMLTACFLAGVFCFAGDQYRNRFRFFAQHNERPRLLWLSRNLFWLSTLFVVCGIGVTLMRVSWTPENAGWPLGGFLLFARGPLTMEDFGHKTDWVLIVLRTASYTSGLILGGLLIYSISQWISMICRSTVAALLIASVTGLLALLWTFTMLMIEAPSWSMCLPVAAALACGWWWAPHWITERAWWKGAMAGGGILAAVTLMTCVAVNQYHGRMVPETSVDWQWKRQQNPDVYKKAWELYTAAMASHYRREVIPPETLDPTDPNAHLTQFVDNTPETIKALGQAANYVAEHWSEFEGIAPWGSEQHDQSRLPSPLEPLVNDQSHHNLTIWMKMGSESWWRIYKEEVVEAWNLLETRLKIDQQMAHFHATFRHNWSLLRHISEWSELPGVNETMLQHAIEILDATEVDVWENRRREIVWQHQSDSYADWHTGDFRQSLFGIAQRLVPADEIRWQRLGQQMTTLLLEQTGELRTRTLQGQRVFFPSDDPRSLSNFVTPNRFDELFDWSWRSLRAGDLGNLAVSNYRVIQSHLRFQAARLALRTKLGIKIYKLRKGHLPDSLEDLVTEGVIDKLPLDPITQAPLAWLPNGLDLPIYDPTGPAGTDLYVESIPEHRAVLFATSDANLVQSRLKVITEDQVSQAVWIHPARLRFRELPGYRNGGHYDPDRPSFILGVPDQSAAEAGE
ncbi:MAG: hypothetical protein ACR2NP_06765 [Pirellulaceae bacterium]